MTRVARIASRRVRSIDNLSLTLDQSCGFNFGISAWLKFPVPAAPSVSEAGTIAVCTPIRFLQTITTVSVGPSGLRGDLHVLDAE